MRSCCSRSPHRWARAQRHQQAAVKGDLLKYTEWDVKQTMECGADVRLNIEATPELVMAEKPDALIVALGSVPVNPPVPRP